MTPVSTSVEDEDRDELGNVPTRGVPGSRRRPSHIPGIRWSEWRAPPPLSTRADGGPRNHDQPQVGPSVERLRERVSWMADEGLEAATAWNTAWLSVQFRTGDGKKVGFLRWYVHSDRGLEILTAGDDPLLDHINSTETAEIAAVQHRAAPHDRRRYVKAELQLLEPSETAPIGSLLNHKYRGRRRAFRTAFWFTRRLGGPRRQRIDIPIRIAIMNEAQK